MCVINDEPWMIKPVLIDLNSVELTLHSVDDLTTKICIPNKSKGINVKVFNMITKTLIAVKRF